MPSLIHKTTSLCPICLTRIPATIERGNSGVFLRKKCQVHGENSTTIWKDTADNAPKFEQWIRPKIPYRSGNRQTVTSDGCPFDCGLCKVHNQRTCTGLIEITQRCNLNCPICFAQSGEGRDIDFLTIRKMLISLHQQTGGCNVQLSGGEPTLHPQLIEIVEEAKAVGFSFIQLNSNGVRLAASKALCLDLKKAGLHSVFLQFDGLDDTVYTTLRGRTLFNIKKKAIENLGESGIGVVLVPVIMPDCNINQLWSIVDFGLNRQPVVRGVHFQPVSYFGRFPASFQPKHCTLPEIISELAYQSGGRLNATDFHPPGCEHALCSFSARYITEEDGTLIRLGAEQKCGCTPQPALQGAITSIAVTARQWSGAESSPEKPKDALDSFLQRAKSFSFTISAMAFMDVWNIDLERLQGCCIHIAQPDGRLLPFCAANLTAQDGQELHHQQNRQQ